MSNYPSITDKFSRGMRVVTVKGNGKVAKIYRDDACMDVTFDDGSTARMAAWAVTSEDGEPALRTATHHNPEPFEECAGIRERIGATEPRYRCDSYTTKPGARTKWLVLESGRIGCLAECDTRDDAERIVSALNAVSA